MISVVTKQKKNIWFVAMYGNSRTMGKFELFLVKLIYFLLYNLVIYIYLQAKWTSKWTVKCRSSYINPNWRWVITKFWPSNIKSIQININTPLIWMSHNDGSKYINACHFSEGLSLVSYIDVDNRLPVIRPALPLLMYVRGLIGNISSTLSPLVS